jgi:hypothetical protein
MEKLINKIASLSIDDNDKVKEIKNYFKDFCYNMRLKFNNKFKMRLEFNRYFNGRDISYLVIQTAKIEARKLMTVSINVNEDFEVELITCLESFNCPVKCNSVESLENVLIQVLSDERFIGEIKYFAELEGF